MSAVATMNQPIDLSIPAISDEKKSKLLGKLKSAFKKAAPKVAFVAGAKWGAKGGAVALAGGSGSLLAVAAAAATGAVVGAVAGVGYDISKDCIITYKETKDLSEVKEILRKSFKNGTYKKTFKKSILFGAIGGSVAFIFTELEIGQNALAKLAAGRDVVAAYLVDKSEAVVSIASSLKNTGHTYMTEFFESDDGKKLVSAFSEKTAEVSALLDKASSAALIVASSLKERMVQSVSSLSQLKKPFMSAVSKTASAVGSVFGVTSANAGNLTDGMKAEIAKIEKAMLESENSGAEAEAELSPLEEKISSVMEGVKTEGWTGTADDTLKDAKNGNLKAFEEMGQNYINGTNGVSQDGAKAKEWLEIGAAEGHEGSASLLKDMLPNKDIDASKNAGFDNGLHASGEEQIAGEVDIIPSANDNVGEADNATAPTPVVTSANAGDLPYEMKTEIEKIIEAMSEVKEAYFPLANENVAEVDNATASTPEVSGDIDDRYNAAYSEHVNDNVGGLDDTPTLLMTEVEKESEVKPAELAQKEVSTPKVESTPALQTTAMVDTSNWNSDAKNMLAKAEAGNARSMKHMADYYFNERDNGVLKNKDMSISWAARSAAAGYKGGETFLEGLASMGKVERADIKGLIAAAKSGAFDSAAPVVATISEPEVKPITKAVETVKEAVIKPVQNISDFAVGLKENTLSKLQGVREASQDLTEKLKGLEITSEGLKSLINIDALGKAPAAMAKNIATFDVGGSSLKDAASKLGINQETLQKVLGGDSHNSLITNASTALKQSITNISGGFNNTSKSVLDYAGKVSGTLASNVSPSSEKPKMLTKLCRVFTDTMTCKDVAFSPSEPPDGSFAMHYQVGKPPSDSVLSMALSGFISNQNTPNQLAANFR